MQSFEQNQCGKVSVFCGKVEKVVENIHREGFSPHLWKRINSEINKGKTPEAVERKRRDREKENFFNKSTTPTTTTNFYIR
ncbi:MAG: hypothetical protein ACR2NQ_03290 [Thermodesulfobacteriota bacterium]